MSEQTSSKPGTPPETADSAGVGALLSASRQRVGEDLRDVAAMLRIRHPYLEAIEEGRYAALPGQTYAIGFVRAYAEHLGLDSEEVVRRYKAEVARSGTRHDLHFPTPMAETGIPGGAIVFVGLVVAVLVYGGWYLSTAEDGFLSDLVSPLPERLAALVSGDEAPAKADTAAPAATTPAEAKPAEPAPAKPEEAKAEPAQTDPNKAEAAKTEPVKTEPAASEPPKPASESAAAETKPAQSSSSASATPAADKPVEPAPTATTAPAATPAPAAATPAVEKPAEPKPATQQAPAAAQAVSQPAAPSPQPAPANVPAAAPAASAYAPAAAPAPKVSATPAPVAATATSSETAAAPAASAPVAEKPARIVVKAKANSWIEVHDDFFNTTLVSRMLRAGESYAVPDKTGLSLITGNAGALEITVDGTAVPAIGANGAVRRGVQLVPELLKAGTATQ